MGEAKYKRRNANGNGVWFSKLPLLVRHHQTPQMRHFVKWLSQLLHRFCLMSEPLSHSLDSFSSIWIGPYACQSTHSLDVLPSKRASVPPTRFYVEFMGQAQSLEKLSSERAWLIRAFGLSSEWLRTYYLYSAC